MSNRIKKLNVRQYLTQCNKCGGTYDDKTGDKVCPYCDGKTGAGRVRSYC